MATKPQRDADAVTPADRALIEELAEVGVAVTPYQLKELRGAKLIPSAQEPGSGRGRGRPSLGYPAGTAQRVRDIERIRSMGFRVPTRDIAMWLFLLSIPIELDLVRASFHQEHSKFISKFPTDPDSVEMESLRQRGETRFSRSFLGKFLASATGSRSIRSESSSTGVVARSFMYLMAGETLAAEARRSLARAVFGEDREGGAAFFRELRTIIPRNFDVKLDQLTDNELVAARDDFAKMIELVFSITGMRDELRTLDWIPKLRSRFIFDAHVGMIGVIQIASMKQSRFGNLSSQLTEVLHEYRTTPHESLGSSGGAAPPLDA